MDINHAMTDEIIESRVLCTYTVAELRRYLLARHGVDLPYWTPKRHVISAITAALFGVTIDWGY